MSEYQYYEFQAIDRPLTSKEMTALRACSTRARITPTSFVNDYSWGDLKGDPDDWMERYFDAHLYVANWGTHILKLRLPERLLDLKTARVYASGDHVSVRTTNGKVILTFHSEDEGVGDWEEGEGELAALISTRSEIARGDHRALYLGWLLSARSGDLEHDDLEPPVPPGLGQLSASLEALASFLRIDAELLEVAAETSSPMGESEPGTDDVRHWISRLTAREKNRIIERLIAEGATQLGSELLQRVRQGGGSTLKPTSMAKRRTVGEMLHAAEAANAERSRVASEKAARDKARREREAALARERHLDALVGKEDASWRQVDALIAATKPKTYDAAVKLLTDLRDLAARGNTTAFWRRMAALRESHSGKALLSPPAS